MSAKLDKSTEEWGKSYANVPVDNIKLDNPFVGKEPFKVTHGMNEPTKMSFLMSGEYSRIWNRDHDQYMKRRQKKSTTTNVTKPNVHARKPTEKSLKEPDQPKAMIRCKKYDNVRSKINNGK